MKKRGGLVLTRLDGEDVLIGQDIRVELIEGRAGRARLRIVAPSDVEIDRGEVRKRVEREGRRKRRKAS